MKAAEKKKIIRTIQSVAPNLFAKGSLLAVTPRGRVLRGIYLEDSIDPTGVYVWAFVQPLYVPVTTFAFNLGERLGGGSKTWTTAESLSLAKKVRDEGLPFLMPTSRPEDLADWEVLRGNSDMYARQANAYSLVASGQMAKAMKPLRELVNFLSTDGRAWVVEAREQAQRLADLAEADPDAALRLLDTWEAQTVSALKIQDVP